MQATLTQPWEVTNTRSNSWCVHLLPSLTDLAFLLPVFLLFGILPGSRTLFRDGDTGWHIRTGEWILQHHTVPKVDLFSFTKPDQPWFAWEWGWDALFAGIHQVWGLAGVAFVNLLLLAMVSALLFRLIRRVSDNDVLALGFTMLAMCGSVIHWLARPHLFSWLFLLIFLHVIVSAEKGHFKGLYWLPFVTVIWTNVHGSFFVGIALLITVAAGEALQVAFEAGGTWTATYRRSRPYLVCAAACGLATLANPYGWRLHQHVAAYLGNSKLLDNIQEYQSISFHHGSIFFESMLLLGIASALWCFQNRKFPGALLLLVWSHLALISGRNIPLFLLVAGPYAACMLQDFLRRLMSVRWASTAGLALSEIARELQPIERIERWHLVSAAALLFVVCSFSLKKPGFEGEFEPKSFPIEALPALKTANASRVFTSDQWGDYLIYRLYPQQKVFMDGRTDFYGDAFVTKYQHIFSARYDWESDLKQFGVDAVMVKPDAPLATALKESSNWQLLFDDGSVIVFRAAQYPGKRLERPQSNIGLSPVSLSGEMKLGISTRSQVSGS